MENLSLEENSESYIALVKERTTAQTFHKFQQILVKFGLLKSEDTIDTSTIVSEVRNLFTEHDDDLVEKFHYFLDYSRRYVRPDKKSVKIAMTSCVDFIEKVRWVLNDDDKFLEFYKIVIGFQEHKKVEQVREEARLFFKKHRVPELEIEFGVFLAEKAAKRTVQDMVVANERKRKEAQDSTDRCKRRKYLPLEATKFGIEHLMHTRDLAYKLVLRAKEGAERLIADNSGSKNPKEMIKTADYFRGLNVEFMRDELKFEKFFQKSKLLSKEPMERRKAIFKSKKFVSVMEEGIEILTQNWNEEKKRCIQFSREIDLQIMGLTE